MIETGGLGEISMGGHLEGVDGFWGKVKEMGRDIWENYGDREAVRPPDAVSPPYSDRGTIYQPPVVQQPILTNMPVIDPAVSGGGVDVKKVVIGAGVAFLLYKVFF